MKVAVLVLCAAAVIATATPVIEETDEIVSDNIAPEEITKADEEVLGNATLRIADVEFEKPLQENEEKISYAGSQLWKVVLETNSKKKVIAKLRDTRDLSMWGGNLTAIDVLVKAKSKGLVKNQLDLNGIQYEIIIDDLQKAIDDENPPVDEDEDEGLENRQGHRMTWQAYHRLDDVHSYLDYLEQTYPALCSSQVIGSSVHGRPLKLLKISNGKPGNKAIWVDGGMHAREWISPATVTYIINHLVLNIDSEPNELQNIDWYFLPIANPDGYEYSHTTDRLWRKNRARSGQCAGTDLNRNFGYKWGGKGSGRNPCQEIYAGTGPFSEPETAAIRTFITSTKAKWRAYVSFHSYGQYILYPWGYDRVVTPDYKELQTVAQKASNAIRASGGPAYTFGPAGSTLYPASGGSDDWAKGTVGMKYAYTIELRDSGRYGFVLPATYIKPTATEAWQALRVIAQAAAA
ncbi:PREDICTED: carboxypeptidase B-like [Nicrophorus vespilloides]|uniref:Carboxypeptidase B-like n=1 Tax=Nicrophorus vespilloides TaxID=110193 RepID=A0ABM1M207_NICVS|nr:PREDICTED: carboxypeptidase B-like [Nicrophorus vespilloides]